MSRRSVENDEDIFADSTDDPEDRRTHDQSPIYVQIQQIKLKLKDTEEQVKKMGEMEKAGTIVSLLQAFFYRVQEIRELEASDEGKKESIISMAQWLTRIKSQKQNIIYEANTLEVLLMNREDDFLELALSMQAYHKQFNDLLQKHKLQRTTDDDLTVEIQESLSRISSNIQSHIQAHGRHETVFLDVKWVRSLVEKEIKEHEQILSTM